MPNLFLAIIITSTTYIKICLRKPKIIILKGYFIPNYLFLLLCGDIESNPSLMPNLLHTHPSSHKRRNKTYLYLALLNCNQTTNIYQKSLPHFFSLYILNIQTPLHLIPTYKTTCIKTQITHFKDFYML